ncbi:MAG: hypothetical protein HGA80_01775 [Candidatus Omnitrophica bacterium]|nr:hypothetical protein [Candidatus Omnitrophota bacterium]
MKNHLLILRLLFGGAALISPLLEAREAQALSPAEQAARLEQELVASRSAASPNWKDSVGDIEKTSASLMEEHTRLAGDNSRLSAQLKAANAAIQEQKALSQKHLTELQQRKSYIETPQNVLAAKTGLAEAERSVARKRMDLSCLQTKMRALDTRINLRKLKLSDLSLQQQTLAMDQQTREHFAGSALRSEIASLTAKLESQTEQDKLIRGKIASLQGGNRQIIDEARAQSADATAFRQRLAEAAEQEIKLREQLAGLKARKLGMNNDKSVRRYQALAEARQVASSRVARMEEQLRSLEKSRPAAGNKMSEMREAQITLEKGNKALSGEIDDLRENIAVLEYKISALERYQGRNRNSGR